MSILRRDTSRALDVLGEFAPPAAGEATSFAVTAYGLWKGIGVSKFGLHRRIDALAPYAIQDFQRILRPIARDHRAHEADKVETELCRRLAEPLWFGPKVSCTIDVHVDVDDSVRKQLAEGLNRVLSIVNADDYGHRRADSVVGLHDRWRRILKDMNRTIEDRYGSHLADDPDGYARAVEELLAEGRQRFENLEQTLDRATGNFQRIGLYEYATGYEGALQGLMHYLGVDNPSKQNGQSLS